MKLSELIKQLQDYHTKHGDMDFSVEVLDERRSTDPEDAMMGGDLVGIEHDRDEDGLFGWMSVRRKRDTEPDGAANERRGRQGQ